LRSFVRFVLGTLKSIRPAAAQSLASVYEKPNASSSRERSYLAPDVRFVRHEHGEIATWQFGDPRGRHTCAHVPLDGASQIVL
jgi:hypothetical protein